MNINKDTIGIALLVSNDYETIDYAETDLETDSEDETLKRQITPLTWTHKDADNLEKLFKGFGYMVLRKKNVRAKHFVSFYKDLAENKYPSTCKRILVYFSGHGGDGTLVMQDGITVDIGDVVSCFRVHISNNRKLSEMAKMFFFDACRGSHEDHGHVKRANRVSDITCLGRVPKEGNTLVAFASTQYHVSYGDQTGSRWTNCLVKALKESKESDDVCRILTAANIMMRKEPRKNCFQTAEFISSLANYVCFKQEAIKIKRNIIVVGRTGSGRSSLINNVIGEDYFDVNAYAPMTPLKTQHINREILVDNKTCQCTFIEPPGSFDIFMPPTLGVPNSLRLQADLIDPVRRQIKQIAESDLRVCLEGLNLIIYVVRQGRFTNEDRRAFLRFMDLFKNTKSISAIVITHCECKNDAACSRLVKQFKSDKVTGDVAANMGKGIYTVGFPDLNEMDSEHVGFYKAKIQQDVSKLHQLIQESDDVVNVLETSGPDNTVCSVM